jgi:hypothetical protein
VHEFLNSVGSPEPPAHDRRRPGHLDHWGKIFRSDTKTLCTSCESSVRLAKPQLIRSATLAGDTQKGASPLLQ